MIRSSFSDSVKRKGEKGIRAKEKMGDSVKWQMVKEMERCRNGLAGKFAEWFKIVQFDPLLSKQKSNPYFTSNFWSPEPTLVRFHTIC